MDAWLEVSLEEYKTLRGESAAGTEPATGSELAVLAGLILGAPLLASLVVAIGLDLGSGA